MAKSTVRSGGREVHRLIREIRRLSQGRDLLWRDAIQIGSYKQGVTSQ